MHNVSVYGRKGTDRLYLGHWWEGKKYEQPAKTSDRRKAERMALALEAELRAGTWKPPGEVMRLDDFEAEYQKRYMAVDPKLLPSRALAWKSNIAPLRHLIGYLNAQGLKRLSQVTSKHVEDFRDWRLTQKFSRKPGGTEYPVAGETVNRDLRIGKAAFGVALRRGWVRENPFCGVKKVKTPQYEPRVLSIFEVKKILAMPVDCYAAYPFMMLALYAGLRESESIALEWSQVDFETGHLSVENTETFVTKSRKARLVPIHPTLAAYLRARGPQEGLVAPNPEKARYHPSTVYHGCNRLLEAAGITDASIHDLRRTWVTGLLDGGVAMNRVRDYAGHASLVTTEKSYVRRGTTDGAEDIKALSFGGPVGETAGERSAKQA